MDRDDAREARQLDDVALRNGHLDAVVGVLHLADHLGIRPSELSVQLVLLRSELLPDRLLVSVAQLAAVALSVRVLHRDRRAGELEHDGHELRAQRRGHELRMLPC